MVLEWLLKLVVFSSASMFEVDFFENVLAANPLENRLYLMISWSFESLEYGLAQWLKWLLFECWFPED